jgi:DNA-binding response OmpR family regulator
MNECILLIEDNEQILYGNARMLKRRGYDVMMALTLREAREKIAKTKPDAAVLDIMLPDGSGLDFMRELRRHSNVPVLLLTGLTTSKDIIRGLTEGGDDYITKPYDFGVLLARLEALLRRANQPIKVVSKGSLSFDIISNRAYLHGDDLRLSPKEFAVLLLLSENTGRDISAKYIYESVWKQPYTDENTSLKNIVSRLRGKLGEHYEISNDRLEDVYSLQRLQM